MLIFSSTTWSAKSSRPRAMAPTNTATWCVWGRVGKKRERRTVGASPDNARNDPVSYAIELGDPQLRRTEFVGVWGEMVCHGVLWQGQALQKKKPKRQTDFDDF